MTGRRVMVLGLAGFVIFGCAHTSVLEKGEMRYAEGRVADAEETLKPLTKMQDQNYPLYLLSLGTVELSLGDYPKAGEYLDAAIKNLSVELSGAATGMALIKSESNRPYRGFPHEKVLAHTYLGLAFFEQNKLEDAHIEFVKAREADHGAQAGQEADFTTAEFLDGIYSLRTGKFNDAEVSFRKVTELHKDWPLGWYALCRASDSNHDTRDADEAWGKYEAATSADARLARDGSTPCAIFLVDAGAGPTRKPNAIAGDIGTWAVTPTHENVVHLGTEGGAKLDAATVDDLYFQASTAGGLAGELSRKVASAAAKSIANQIPILGLFVGKAEVDVRTWKISPGTMHLAALPIATSPSTVEVTCSDQAGNAVPMSRQVLYYIGGRPFDRAPLIYSRILPNADERATVHTPKS
jgi:tetratricopeptide (TPR) repeat protein